MQPTDKQTIAGISRKSTVTVVVVMQAPFKELGVVIDVACFVMKEKIPTLLSIKDIL